MTPARQLRELILNHPPVVAPGAFDGLSARLVEQAGFAAVYATGGGIARSTGIPDLGLMSLDEIVKRLETMVEVTQIPPRRRAQRPERFSGRSGRCHDPYPHRRSAGSG